MMNNTDIEIEVPPIFLPLFTEVTDYYDLQGGRGSGKSWSVAIRLVVEMLEKKVFVVCGREVQKTLDHSVYRLVNNTINRLGFANFFKLKDKFLTCTLTGSEMYFTGLKNDPDAVKSLEGADRVWIEEAQSISHAIMEVLIPTVRKEGSQILFTRNIRYPTDAVDQFFNDPEVLKNTTQIIANWRDNPYFNEKQERSRQACLINNPWNYDHIWEGGYKEDAGELAVLPSKMLRRCVGITLPKMWGQTGQKFMGVDVGNGGADVSAQTIRQGSVVLACETYALDDTALLADKIVPILYEDGITGVYYDANGVGAGLKGEFAKRNRSSRSGLPFAVNPFFAQAQVRGGDKIYIRGSDRETDRTNKQYFWRLKDQAWWNIRQRVVNTCNILDGKGGDLSRTFVISNNIPKLEQDELIKELSQASYTTNNQDQIVVDKQPEGRASPNRADSVIMAFCNDLRKGLKA